MNKLCYSISVLLTSSCIYGIANAEDFYLRADLGVAQSNRVSSNGEFFYKDSNEKKFSNGIVYSVGVGYKLKYNLRTELAYNRSNLKYSANIDNSGAYKAYKQKLQINALMANIIYDIQLPSNYRFNPYLGIGLGYAQLKPGEASLSSNNNVVNFKANNSNNFTYAISGGVAFPLNEQIMLDIGYKFQDFGKVKNISSIKVSNFPRYRDYKKVKPGFKVRTHNIMAGIRYTWSSWG